MDIGINATDFPLAPVWEEFGLKEVVVSVFEVDLDIEELPQSINDPHQAAKLIGEYVRSLEASEDRFAVLIPGRPPLVGLRGNTLSAGHTLVTHGDHIMGYQPVIFRFGSARNQFLCSGGMIVELDKEFVSAWDGKTMDLRTSRFSGRLERS